MPKIIPFETVSPEEYALLEYVFNAVSKDTLLRIAEKSIATGRKNHQLFIVSHHSKRYFVKIFHASKHAKWARRVELGLKDIFSSGAKRCFEGSAMLYRNGIPTAKPIGYFSMASLPWNKKSVAIFEAIEDAKELKELYVNHESFFEELFMSMAECTKKMHDANIRHTDIVLHNFLVKEECGAQKLYLIDTDKVHYAGLSRISYLTKTFFDMHCIRRIEVNEREVALFLKHYFGKHYTPFWGKVLSFWSKKSR
ncbi:MAG: lipopolysaccharide kinase [Campylobacterales bacterium]|nr:lipopolysaccharide kinase [Campylobacterales bacterium]